MFTKCVELIRDGASDNTQVKFTYHVPTFDRSGRDTGNKVEFKSYPRVSDSSIERLRRWINKEGNTTIYVAKKWMFVSVYRHA